MRIASFGFRSFPPREGSAGADKFVAELLPRMVKRGHKVTAYNRSYEGDPPSPPREYLGVNVVTLRTVRRSGLEALLHSARVTFDIIWYNRADVVHIQNGGNSPFALILRLFGKRTILTEDGKEWEREKWSWAGRVYLRSMILLTAFVHTRVVFDNVFARDYFEKRFKRRYECIPYGADVVYDSNSEHILSKLSLTPGRYVLFVGRFIPDKGLHHLIAAFEQISTDMKLVLVGGSPYPSEYAERLKATRDPRIVFPGYVYGSSVHALMKNCYAYVQPSNLEGLSPVILESSYLGAPVICSDIEMNREELKEHGIYFKKSDVDDLKRVLCRAINDQEWLREYGRRQQTYVQENYSWDSVVDQYLSVFAA